MANKFDLTVEQHRIIKSCSLTFTLLHIEMLKIVILQATLFEFQYFESASSKLFYA
jgi:hypothetical protein